MVPATSSRSAPPPSHQEVTRKLSVHSAVRPIPKKPAVATAPISGTESDSDSVLSPEVYAASPLHTPVGLSHGVASLAQPPLQAIAERRSGSGGEESEEEDEEDEEGGWKTTATAERPRGSHDETVLKTGYLWKKGERRKTWKKRWFVLRPAHLAFYKTSAEYKLLRLLELSDIHSSTAVQLKKHQNTFVLVSPTRTFYLQAESPHEVTEWVKAITDARTSLQATSTQSSVVTAPIPIPRTTSQRHSYQQQPQQSAPPASPSLSHSPYNHHLTSSESDDASSSMPRPTPMIPNATPAAVSDLASPSKQPGSIDTFKVILSGYLMKCGSRRHIWHNRWFVLTGDKLVYSRSHMDTKPHRSIPLAQILDALEYDLPSRLTQPALALSPPHHHHHSSKEGDEHDGGDGKHTFKIVTTKRTLLVCAPSEEEEIKWLSAVRALIARRSAVPGDSAAAITIGTASHSHSMPAPLLAQNLPASYAAHPAGTCTAAVAAAGGAPAAASAMTKSASVPLAASATEASMSASGPGSSATLVGSSAGAGSAGGHRRRDSIVRRLSEAGSFLTHPTSSFSISGSGGGTGGGGGSSQAAAVPQEA